jgi:hypothetical protein
MNAARPPRALWRCANDCTAHPLEDCEAMAAPTRLQLLFTLVCALVAPRLAAQTLIVEPATGAAGGSVDVVIRFVPGAVPVSGYDLIFLYPGVLFGTPAVVPGAAPCAADDSGTRISVIRFAALFDPLPAERACTIRFPVEPTAVPGNYSFSGADFQFGDTNGEPVAGTLTLGMVTVVASGPPRLSFQPAADADGQADGNPELSLEATDDQPVAAGSIGLALSAGSTGTGVELSCTVSGGFSLVSGASQVLASGALPAPIVLSCTPSTVPIGGLLSCSERATPAGTPQPRNWDLACAARLLRDGFESP